MRVLRLQRLPPRRPTEALGDNVRYLGAATNTWAQSMHPRASYECWSHRQEVTQALAVSQEDAGVRPSFRGVKL